MPIIPMVTATLSSRRDRLQTAYLNRLPGVIGVSAVSGHVLELGYSGIGPGQEFVDVTVGMPIDDFTDYIF